MRSSTVYPANTLKLACYECCRANSASLNGLRKLVFGSALYITCHAIYSVNVSARHASASAMCFGGSRTSGSSDIAQVFLKDPELRGHL